MQESILLAETEGPKMSILLMFPVGGNLMSTTFFWLPSDFLSHLVSGYLLIWINPWTHTNAKINKKIKFNKKKTTAK